MGRIGLRFKKRTYRVSWTKTSEINQEGKGFYCQHGLAEDTANYLASILIKSGENTNVLIEEDF